MSPREPDPHAPPPRRLVDTTGEVAEIERLLERVGDLGEVVLAGPPLPADATIDLYTNLHVRGLTLLAAAEPDEPASG